VPCWVDTNQPDAAAAAEFYSGLFGWETEDGMPPDSGQNYFMGRLGGRDVGAISGPSEQPPVWTTSAYPVGSGCGLVTACDLAVGVGIVEGAESEQRLEGGHWGAAPVVAKDVFVEVDGEVFVGGAPVGAEQPGVEVRDRAAGPEILAIETSASGGSSGPVVAARSDESASGSPARPPARAERRVVGTAQQHLAGHVRVAVRRRGRALFQGESRLAGLERGHR